MFAMMLTTSSSLVVPHYAPHYAPPSTVAPAHQELRQLDVLDKSDGIFPSSFALVAVDDEQAQKADPRLALLVFGLGPTFQVVKKLSEQSKDE